MSETKLSDRQQYWFEHLQVAEERGITLVAYAAQQELKVKDLYNWKSRFIKTGVMDRSRGSEDFVRLQTERELSCCVCLPNGVRVEFCPPLSERAIREVLQAARMLT